MTFFSVFLEEPSQWHLVGSLRLRQAQAGTCCLLVAASPPPFSGWSHLSDKDKDKDKECVVVSPSPYSDWSYLSAGNQGSSTCT